MKKLLGGRKQDKSEGAGVALTQLSREQAPRQAPMTAAAGRGEGREGARRGAGSGRAPVGLRAPRPGPAPRPVAPPRPRPAPPGRALAVFRCAPASRHSPGQVRPAAPGKGVERCLRGCASRATGPTQAGARVLVPREGLELRRPGFESG